MNKIITTDFRSNYKKIFPNLPAIVFGFIGIIPFIILLYFAIKRLTYKDHPFSTADRSAVNCTKFMVLSIYDIFHRVFFIFFICIIRYE